MEQTTLAPEEITKKKAELKAKLIAHPSPKEAKEIESMSLVQKLIKIELDMPEIQKTGQNKDKSGNVQYEFVEQQTIMHAVRPLLLKYGVLVIPRVDDHKLHNKQGIDSRTGNEVSKGVKVVAKMTFTFINAHQPDDRLDIPWTAEGDDYGDKGTNKATTIAQKNMYIRLFNIADTDPDQTSPAEGGLEAPEKPATADKHTVVYTMLKRLKISPADFEAKQKKPVEKMTNAEVAEAVTRMEAVIARLNAQEAAGVQPQ